ncbi:hypothetical protein [Burkholderia phage BCSR5]|nr:hypothetical protein [Burkholderia phage BCSR5]
MEFSISGGSSGVKKKKKAVEDSELPKKKKKVKTEKKVLTDDELLGQKLKDKDRIKKKKKKYAEEDEKARKKKSKDEGWEDAESIELTKKKKKSTSLVTLKPDEVSTEKAGRRISRLKKRMNSIVGADAEEIQQMLERNEGDNANTLINKRLLQTFIDLIPFAEHNIRKTKGQKGIYQLTSLTQSIQELLTAMQATADRAAMGSSLVMQVVQPAFLEIGTSVIKEFQALEGELRALIPDTERRALQRVMSESRVRIGQQLDSRYKDVRDGIIGFMER